MPATIELDERIGLRMQADGKTAEVFLYDVIGEGFFGGISAKDFVDQLGELGEIETLNVRINSPGGSVFEGVTIYNALVRHDANVVVHVDALAASAASLIAMAGDEIRIAENALMMIHDPMGFFYGSAAEMRKTATILDKVKSLSVNTYAARTKQTKKTLGAMMAEETWMDADEAKQLGFADEVTEAKQIDNRFDLSMFRHVPAHLQLAAGPVPTPRLFAPINNLGDPPVAQETPPAVSVETASDGKSITLDQLRAELLAELKTALTADNAGPPAGVPAQPAAAAVSQPAAPEATAKAAQMDPAERAEQIVALGAAAGLEPKEISALVADKRKGVLDVVAELKEKLVAGRKPVGSGGDATAATPQDADAEVRAEYAQNCELLGSQNLSFEAYRRSRAITAGEEPLLTYAQQTPQGEAIA